MLVDEGAEVRALVRPGSKTRLPSSVPVNRCELGDARGLAAAMQGAGMIFNCIGHSADWGSWEEFYEGNVTAVERLCCAAVQAGVKRVVHVSTTDVYGYPKVAPDESHPLLDVGLPYNRSKIAGEKLARNLGRELGLEVTIVRPAMIVGPRCKDWVIELGRHLQAGQVAWIDHGRTNTGLVYVDDVAHAMMTLAVDGEPGGTYNVADPTPITWRSYVTQLAETLRVPVPRLSVPASVAFPMAWGCEIAGRLLCLRTRPLATRHLIHLLSKDQDFPVASLRARIPAFPRVGIVKGLAATRRWIENELQKPDGMFVRPPSR